MVPNTNWGWALEIRRVDILNNPRWRREVDWVSQGWMDRQVVLTIGGQPVAVLSGVSEGEIAANICERWHRHDPPFTRQQLQAWHRKLLESIRPEELFEGSFDEGKAGQ